jgi:hypothetical protein
MSHAANINNAYHFVLWGADCEETMAVIFITAFRSAGLRVKLVGVNGGRIRGAHGLCLLPDLPLHDALPLARHAQSVIIPCAGEGLQRFAKDPRLYKFLQRSQANNAQFVMLEGEETPLITELGLLTSPGGLRLLPLVDQVEECVRCADQLVQGWCSTLGDA